MSIIEPLHISTSTEVIFHKELSAPALPNHFQNFIRNLAPEYISDKSRRTTFRGDKIVPNAHYSYKMITAKDFPEFFSWVEKNVIRQKGPAWDLAMQRTFGEKNHTPHTDFKRHWGLNYLVDSGGKQVKTSWYKEKGKPLYRDSGLCVRRMEDLETVHSTVLEEGRWHMLSTNILHGVENIESSRTSLTISIWDKKLATRLLT
jgi:hypothetical protein